MLSQLSAKFSGTHQKTLGLPSGHELALKRHPYVVLRVSGTSEYWRPLFLQRHFGSEHSPQPALGRRFRRQQLKKMSPQRRLGPIVANIEPLMIKKSLWFRCSRQPWVQAGIQRLALTDQY